jgi:alcohol dehydrogenase (cytochrome c)
MEDEVSRDAFITKLARRRGMLGGLAAAALLGGFAAEAQQVPGRAAFEAACAHCHGTDGRGGELGPPVFERVAESDDEALETFLRAGLPERGMPPAPLPAEELGALVAYLRVLTAAAPSAAPADDASSRTVTRRPVEPFAPVTAAMLLDPDPSDWLWFSRTPDAQRYSPLDQIDVSNVDRLALAWSRGLPQGLSTTIPTVYAGVMYLTEPGGHVVALDAATGDLHWEYRREYANPGVGALSRSKNLSIFEDMVYFTAPDSTVVALDARTGEVRWEAAAGARAHTSGTIIVDGKVVSAGNCTRGPRDACFIAAHDARTGALVWAFNTVQAPGDPPGFDTWAGAPLDGRLASPWGLPGSYDAESGLIYWGVANPMPNTRAARHGGDAAAIPYSAPADLYSNSTVALDPASGELVWYYQHLPGDDWDLDMNQERIVLRTRIDPDPEHVRWINPNVERGTVRDVVVNVGEGGGLWLLDKHDGEFIWATPFPFDVDNFALSDIDVETGATHINRDLILYEPGDRRVICYFNTRSFWPAAYHAEKNALYVPYIRNCLEMTAEIPASDGDAGAPETRVGTPEPGVELDALNGLARVSLETGEVTHWPTGRIPTNSAILATAGDLVFWGDINRRFRAVHADTGETLWETILGGPISVSNITYAVDGRQYVAVIAGETLSQRVLTTGDMGPIRLDLKASYGSNAIYVFALPEAPL